MHRYKRVGEKMVAASDGVWVCFDEAQTMHEKTLEILFEVVQKKCHFSYEVKGTTMYRKAHSDGSTPLANALRLLAKHGKITLEQDAGDYVTGTWV